LFTRFINSVSASEIVSNVGIVEVGVKVGEGIGVEVGVKVGEGIGVEVGVEGGAEEGSKNQTLYFNAYKKITKIKTDRKKYQIIFITSIFKEIYIFKNCKNLQNQFFIRDFH
jgi:hypothetical protein